MSRLFQKNPLKIYLLKISITALSVFLLANLCAFASPDTTLQSYVNVKKEFQRLRNTDSHILKEAEWLKLITQLTDFSQSLPQEQAAESLFLVGQGYASLWKEKQEKEYFDKASESFKSIFDNLPNTTKAASSLLELYKLHHEVDSSLAEAFLEKIIKKYPQSEYAVFATEKLNNNLKSADDNLNSVVDADSFKVVIDPGHGGEDFGAVGVGGIYEKDIVLEIAYSLKKQLEENSNIKVLLTRTTDQFIPLQQRTEFANNNQADLFISIHCNASEKKNLSGFESFVLDENGDNAALLLAQRENASSDGGGNQSNDDISMMLSDLIQSTKKPESISLANLVTNSIRAELSKSDEYQNLSIKKPRKAPFYVLVGAHMPAVLLELSYVDNELDGPLLASPQFRNTLVSGMINGIKAYKAKHDTGNS
jgi:N-acetylmuramoyl-L-alanine amidase